MPEPRRPRLQRGRTTPQRDATATMRQSHEREQERDRVDREVRRVFALAHIDPRPGVPRAYRASTSARNIRNEPPNHLIWSAPVRRRESARRESIQPTEGPHSVIRKSGLSSVALRLTIFCGSRGSRNPTMRGALSHLPATSLSGWSIQREEAAMSVDALFLKDLPHLGERTRESSADDLRVVARAGCGRANDVCEEHRRELSLFGHAAV